MANIVKQCTWVCCCFDSPKPDEMAMSMKTSLSVFTNSKKMSSKTVSSDNEEGACRTVKTQVLPIQLQEMILQKNHLIDVLA